MDQYLLTHQELGKGNKVKTTLVKGEVSGIGTDVTQTKMTSYKIENFFSVSRTGSSYITLELSGLALSYRPYKKI